MPKTMNNPTKPVRNLDRPRIRKLLAIGLFSSILTGVGDFLLDFASTVDVGGGFVDGLVATAPNLPDWQLFVGSLLGVFGIVIEGLCLFAVYRLMADAAPGYAHAYRASIFGYIWLAPIGCHMNMGLLNFAYKYLLKADPSVAHQVIVPMYLVFCLPLYVLLVCCWLPGIVVQWRASPGDSPRILVARGGSTSLSAGFPRWLSPCCWVRSMPLVRPSARCSSRLATPSCSAACW